MSETYRIVVRSDASPDPLPGPLRYRSIWFDTDLHYPNRTFSAVRARRVWFPNILYNVTDTNHHMAVTIAGTVYSITVPIGYYDLNQLISVILASAAIALAATTYVMVLTYNPITMRTTLAFRDISIPAYVAFSLYAPPGYPHINLLRLLGFFEQLTVASAGPILSDGIPASDANKFMFIWCYEAAGKYGILVGQRNNPGVELFGIVAVVPLCLPKGQICDYHPGNNAPWIPLIIPTGYTPARPGHYLQFIPRPEIEDGLPDLNISWVMELEFR
jgi:hypothetical protein